MPQIEHFVLHVSGQIDEQQGRIIQQLGSPFKGRILEERGRAKRKIAKVRMDLEANLHRLRTLHDITNPR